MIRPCVAGNRLGYHERCDQVRIYRWKGAGWSLTGIVNVPTLPSIREGGFVVARSQVRGLPAPRNTAGTTARMPQAVDTSPSHLGFGCIIRA